MSESNDSSRADKQARIRQRVAEQIKLTRGEIGLTQRQLAEIAGFKQTLISKMERGQCLTITNLAIVAEALGVPLIRLFLDVM
jgi:transcriptional regulator with XRE-family HTH domain